MARRVKFAVNTLVFYGLDTLELMLRNTGHSVDRIYLSHSSLPWNEYNPSARTKYVTTIDSSFVDSLPYREKIVWLEGEWKTEEDQRNHALDHALKDGMDYLIIQDVDEFYLRDDFEKNLLAITMHPEHPVYRCPWIVFWKTLKYVIQVREHEGVKAATVTTCPNFAVNVKYPGIRFEKRRLANRMESAFMLPGLCLHLAWVLSDEEVLKKIQTWGHSHQFNHKKWYVQKWLTWTPRTRYIGHITRANYLRAVPYNGTLPSELNDFLPKKQTTKSLSLLEKIDSIFRDVFSLLRVRLVSLKNRLLKTRMRKGKF